MNYIQKSDGQIISLFDDKSHEANIYRYKHKKYVDTVLLKLFKIYDDVDLESKKDKISMIMSSPYFKDEIRILDGVLGDFGFIGYTMQESFTNTLNSSYSKKRKIKHLLLLREKIELLNSKGIFIGDYWERNFLISHDDNILRLCDLDNLKIGDFDFNVTTPYIRDFRRNCSHDEFLDSFCFNLFTISYLDKIELTYLHQYMGDFTLPKELDTKENREIFDGMLHLDDSYKYEFLIDYIK